MASSAREWPEEDVLGEFDAATVSLLGDDATASLHGDDVESDDFMEVETADSTSQKPPDDAHMVTGWIQRWSSFMAGRGYGELHGLPIVDGFDIDAYSFYHRVVSRGGLEEVGLHSSCRSLELSTRERLWK